LPGKPIEAEAGDTHDVLQNGLVQNLRAELAKAEARLRDVSSQYGPNHPLYQRTEAEVRTLREAVAAETSRAAGTMGSNARVAREREAQIRAAYEAQRKRVLEMKVARDEASLLVRDVENANKEYDVCLRVLGRPTSRACEAVQRHDILNRAMESFYPSTRLVLNVVPPCSRPGCGMAQRSA
jgi:hypothetical protein